MINNFNYSESIYNALRYKLSNDKNFSIIGQGLWSPWYVGNTMKDLEIKFGKKRILDTPVSEAASTGLALGASLHGSKVMILHPRMDFSLLAFDQIINQVVRYYSYIPKNENQGLIVEIDGVDTYSSHRLLLKKIREIELVESMQITNVRGSKIRLSVQVEGEIQRFYTAMLRSGHFARRRADQLADGFTIHLNWIAK